MIPHYKVTESDQQRLIKRLGKNKALAVIVAIEYESLTQQQQADILDVARMTLYRWRQEPRFIAEYDRLHEKKSRFIMQSFRKRNNIRYSVNEIISNQTLLQRILL